jgi:hypothetical protein
MLSMRDMAVLGPARLAQVSSMHQSWNMMRRSGDANVLLELLLHGVGHHLRQFRTSVSSLTHRGTSARQLARPITPTIAALRHPVDPNLNLSFLYGRPTMSFGSKIRVATFSRNRRIYTKMCLASWTLDTTISIDKDATLIMERR